MDYEELSEKLYQKAADELEAYHNHLLQQSPEETLEHTYEYTAKSNILICLMTIEPDELSAGQLTALLASPSPLEDIYREFRDMDTGLMNAIQECAGELADRRIADQQQAHKRSVRERLAAKPVHDKKPVITGMPQRER